LFFLFSYLFSFIFFSPSFFQSSIAKSNATETLVLSAIIPAITSISNIAKESKTNELDSSNISPLVDAATRLLVGPFARISPSLPSLSLFWFAERCGEHSDFVEEGVFQSQIVQPGFGSCSLLCIVFQNPSSSCFGGLLLPISLIPKIFSSTLLLLSRSY
jgi:hypothetical protein